MLQFPMVRWAALFWGLVALFPIGLNYTAFVLLAAAMLLQRDTGERLARLRRSPNWWPACLFVGWTLLVLLFGPRYPETLSNALHALRIVVTLALALALTRDEAVWALRGLVLGLIACLAVVALDASIGLPFSQLWNSIVHYDGNKSVANAALLALAAVSGLLLLPILRPRQRLVALLLSAGALCALMFVLYSRTAWLIVLVGMTAGLVHQLRAQRQRQLVALAAATTLALVAGLGVPGVKERLELGGHEIVSAYQGKPVDPTSSWGIRFRMYDETVAMVREKPLAGWGIGSWNTQWKLRVQGPLAEANMPHNDFLWMGAQAGVPGALLLLLLVSAGLPSAWRRHDMSGRLGVVALLTMLIAASSNSALRDAAIGLCLWFIVLVFQRLSTEPESVWQQIIPGRAQPGG